MSQETNEIPDDKNDDMPEEIRDIVNYQNEEFTLPANLNDLSVEALLILFEKTILNIRKLVAFAGILLLHLEKRGHDTGDLRRRPIVRTVRNVALGLLLPEVFSTYCARTDIIRAMTSLPIEVQRRLFQEKTVPVVEVVGGKTTHLRVDIADLHPKQVEVVFNKKDGRLRTVAEQAAYISGERIVEGTIKTKIRHDPQTGRIECENATAEQIRSYMNKHGL